MDIKEYRKKQIKCTRHPWEQARLNVVMDIIKPYLRNNLSIADIGCGDTYVLQSIGDCIKSPTLIAVDTAYTPDIIEKLKRENLSTYDMKIKYYNNIEEIKEKKIDLILLMDVIEHIEHDQDFLKKLIESPYCNTETKILITVPAFMSLFSLHDKWLGHYRRYTVRMIKEHLPLELINIKKQGYFFFSLLFPRMLELITQKLLRKKLIDKDGVSVWTGNQIVTNIIKYSLIGDYKILGKRIKLPGLSAYCLLSLNK